MNERTGSYVVIASSLALIFLAVSKARAEEQQLQLVQTIDVKGPAGRLDHLALDSKHGRLFVANMANSSLDIVDLKAGKLLKQIPGQNGIQGVAYAADLNRIFVGNGEGNACNVFDGENYMLLKSLPLDDADNVRYQQSTGRVYVAHAEKSLSVIDAKTFEILDVIKVPGQPESFQLETKRPRLYLNVPSAREVTVIDTEKKKVIADYKLTLAEKNYPMALDEANHRLFIGCRSKPMIVVLDTETGKEVASVPIPGDTDDVFYDAKRKRIYASCGEGFVAVIQQADADHYELLTRIATVTGARTSLFDPQTGRLYLVLPRQHGKDGPEIHVYQAQ